MADFEFDPFEPGPHDQRPTLFASCGERAPICQTGSDLWVVSRYDDVRAMNASPHIFPFSSRPNPYEGHSEDKRDPSPEFVGRLLGVAAEGSRLADDVLQPNPGVLLNRWRKVELTWT